MGQISSSRAGDIEPTLQSVTRNVSSTEAHYITATGSLIRCSPTSLRRFDRLLQRIVPALVSHALASAFSFSLPPLALLLFSDPQSSLSTNANLAFRQ